MSGRFGPDPDVFDARYNAGWRRWSLVIGLAQWQFVRRALGGTWECCWIEPCAAWLWHPVVQMQGAGWWIERYAAPDLFALYTPFRWFFIGVGIWATMQKLLSWLGG